MRIARQMLAAAAGYFALLMLLTQHPAAAVAFRNAHRVTQLESRIGIAPAERWLQHAHLFGTAGDLLYVGMHFGVTTFAVVYLIVVRPAVWVDARWVLAYVFAAAALTFWLLPVAPPWMLGSPDGTPWAHPAGAASGLDLFAAMPSLHAACAVWVVMSLRRAGAPALLWLYAALVAVVVVATGNHYVLDVAVGGLLPVIGGLVVGVLRGPNEAATRGEVLVPGYGC